MTTAAATYGRYRFRNVARMEWVKLRSLRSTGWVLAVTVAGAIGIAVAVGVNTEDAAADLTNNALAGISLGLLLVTLVALGVFTALQLAKIESRSRFVAESRIVALATLGNLSRSFAELRVNVRSYLLATNDAQRTASRAASLGW